MGDERQPAHGQKFAAVVMANDGGGSREAAAAGKKRKATSAETALAAMRREPRRGLGVAELERIRVALEVAERCYAAVTVPSLTAPAPAPPYPPAVALPPSAALAAVRHRHGSSVAHLLPAEQSQIIGRDGGDVHQVGNGASVHQQQLQMPMGYFAPYYVAAQQYESFTRLFTSSENPSPHQNNGRQQADQIQSAVTTALPAAGQAASSESSSSAYQRRLSHRRRAQPPRQQQQPPTGQTAVPAPQVAFVDLVDSDDDDGGGHVEELDLELRL